MVYYGQGILEGSNAVQAAESKPQSLIKEWGFVSASLDSFHPETALFRNLPPASPERERTACHAIP